jgi:uncharacterized protein (TIGR02453 family)
MAIPPFRPSLFRFLRDLAKQNDRAWFQANKQRYDEEVKLPALQFIAGFAKPLAEISPHLRADPRPAGGSLFRIHRDVRFSKDKSPYKTHTGIHFRHAAAQDAYAPGLYLHLEPGNVFVGAGIWHPDAPTTAAIRDAIVDDPAAWQKAVRSKAFGGTWTLDGEALKRAPRGYDAEHPFIEDLKRKSFIATAHLTEKDACADDFATRLARDWRKTTPLLRFVTTALDLPF